MLVFLVCVVCNKFRSDAMFVTMRALIELHGMRASVEMVEPTINLSNKSINKA